MPLASGTRLGPYEIVTPLGAGGMGEVYKARDTRLDRTVAVKVLSARIDSPAARERFEREAKAVSSLSHPHICTLYDVGSQDGLEYLVMEYLEGQSLADRLRHGPLPLGNALEYAIQIAGALEAAHRKGVIHRDLKPGNIILTKSGAKLLDFGLAKMGKVQAAPVATVTLTRALTAEGSILGTLQYMSPEQLEGQEADARSDLFAFGAVLYELLTGRRAFEGRSQSSVIAAIMHVDPPGISVLQPMTPPALERAVKNCLAKDADERWQTAHDLASELQWIASGGVPATGASPASAPRLRRERLAWAVTAVLLFALAAVVIYERRSPREASVVRFSVSAPPNTTFETARFFGNTGLTAGAVSPNGRKIAFTARNESGNMMLWIRALDTLGPKVLPGTENAIMPFWSPDNGSIAFFAEGKLKRIDVEGGSPQIICDASNGGGGSWNRKGIIVFVPGFNAGVVRVSSGGGEPVAVTKLTQKQFGQRIPSFLPDDKHFVYFARGSNEVFLGSLDGEEPRRLLVADSPAIYAAPGYLLFVRQGTLMAQPFDAKNLRLSGEPVPVAEQVYFDGLGVAFSASDTGTLAYRTGGGTANLRLTWVDRSGKPIEIIGAPRGYLGPDLAPDGKRIAIHQHEGMGGDVWIVESSGGKATRLTFDGSQENASPIWSPDGSRIAFGSLRNGKWGIYQRLSNGTGGEELLFESDTLKMPMSWSADGKWILYTGVDPKTNQDVWALSLDGERKASPVLQTRFAEGHPQFSPDGKWMAYESDETGASEVYVQSFPPGAGKWEVSSNGGRFPRWRRDGKELFYMDAFSFGKIVAVGVQTSGSTLEFSAPHPLFDSGYINAPNGHTGNWNTFAVSSDGQRFLIPRPEASVADTPTATPITVVINWTAALKR